MKAIRGYLRLVEFLHGILYWEVSVWLHQADARLPVVWSKLQVQEDARAHNL